MTFSLFQQTDKLFCQLSEAQRLVFSHYEELKEFDMPYEVGDLMFCDDLPEEDKPLMLKAVQSYCTDRLYTKTAEEIGYRVSPTGAYAVKR